MVIQKEQVLLNVEAAPTESLSNGNLDFPDKEGPATLRQIQNMI